MRFSIAALGKLFSSTLYSPTILGKSGSNLPTIGFNWHRGYIGPGSTVEAQILEGGWCPSEIDKIRTQFESLSAMHYTSRMKKPRPQLDHGGCSQHVCRAFQVDMMTYRPLHVHGACGGDCPSIGVDMASVLAILRSTEFYPVLRVQLPVDEREDVKLLVEPYQPSMSYVALSHVWADGLGNPEENALPRCQVARVARHIAVLDKSDGWLWLDTLCCPTETEGKMIALQRMADVYRNAHNVLVLDASDGAQVGGQTPCRASPKDAWLFAMDETAVDAPRCVDGSCLVSCADGCAEGALATSLQIQFADKAVNIMALVTELFTVATKDLRYRRIWMDISNQMRTSSPELGQTALTD